MAMDYSPIFLSIKVALVAVSAVVCFAVPLAGFMGKRDFPGKDVLEAVFTLPLVLPPSVIGFVLLLLFGKNGPLGIVLYNWFHVRLIFTWWGAAIASAVVSFPLMYQSVKAAVEAVDPNLENAARTLGAGELRVFWTITLPLAWTGVIAGLILAFARSLGEFGATLMVAGNIPGKTQTMPLAVYFASESGQTNTAAILVTVMTLFSFIVIFGMNRWSKKRQRNPERG